MHTQKYPENTLNTMNNIRKDTSRLLCPPTFFDMTSDSLAFNFRRANIAS